MSKNEPQSYGSQSEWVTGRTGETVNRASNQPASQGDFYQSRHDGERNHGQQGGELSPRQVAENVQPQPGRTLDDDDTQPIGRVRVAHGGAKRDSSFKRRDYK